MRKSQDLKFVLGTNNVSRATGVISGTIDCRGADTCVLMLDKPIHNAAGALSFTVRHAASTNTFASATAFSTAVSISQTATSAAKTHILDVDMRGVGPYLVYKLSTITASAKAGVYGLLMDNESVPPNSTGFTSITYRPA